MWWQVADGDQAPRASDLVQHCWRRAVPEAQHALELDGLDVVGPRVTREQGCAREQLEQHRAEAEDVPARVGHREGLQADDGQHAFGRDKRGRIFLTNSVLTHAGGGVQIDQLVGSRGCAHDVERFQVAVQHATLVQVMQRFRHLTHQLHDPCQGGVLLQPDDGEIAIRSLHHHAVRVVAETDFSGGHSKVSQVLPAVIEHRDNEPCRATGCDKLVKMLAYSQLLSGICGVIDANRRATGLPGVQTFTTAKLSLELGFVGKEFNGHPLAF